VRVLLDAVAMTPSLRLAVAGDGRERESLEHHARNAGGRVQFLGRVSDVRGVLAGADVVALPSLGGDSMPAVLIEAGFMGLPAVSTPIGSITEVLRHEETGLVVPPGDGTALADALTRVARTDDGTRFGEAARRHCLANFEIGVVAEQWLRVLRAVANGD
jgi:glycosyltransferase involved in cell wall biosynthesis